MLSRNWIRETEKLWETEAPLYSLEQTLRVTSNDNVLHCRSLKRKWGRNYLMENPMRYIDQASLCGDNTDQWWEDIERREVKAFSQHHWFEHNYVRAELRLRK